MNTWYSRESVGAVGRTLGTGVQERLVEHLCGRVGHQLLLARLPTSQRVKVAEVLGQSNLIVYLRRRKVASEWIA